MSQAEKLLQQMRNNPEGDWRIEQLKTVAARYGVTWRASGGSHVTFDSTDKEILTVPAHRPVKSFYVRQFVKFIEAAKNEKDRNT